MEPRNQKGTVKMCRIPEPHELADAHFARLEAEERAMLEEAVCGDCDRYYPVPREWANVPCGYCPIASEHVRYSDSVKDCGCESFKPRQP